MVEEDAHGGLDFADPEWGRLVGGYRTPYDPRSALRRLEQGLDRTSVWDELWTELYHQGDVGTASYASTPHLVRIHLLSGLADWNTYALVATIELARQSGRNPGLPDHLRTDYEAALPQLAGRGLVELVAAEDPTLIASILGVVAIAKGQISLARLAVNFTEDERADLLADSGWF